MSWGCPRAPVIPTMHNPKNNQRRRIAQSFQDAFRGIADCVKMERNMRIHITVCFYIVVCACFIGLERGEFAALFLAIGAVISAEMFNTSIEKLCDFNQKNFNYHIKIIKDISAGAVLVSAFVAACVGFAILFRPELWNFLVMVVNTPQLFLLFLVTLVLAVIFIFIGPVCVADKLRAFWKKK